MALYRRHLPSWWWFWALVVVVAGVDSAISLGNEQATLASGAFNSSEGSYRQDVCDRYLFDTNNSNSTSKTANLANALSGLQVSVSIIPGPRFRYNDTHGIDPIYPGVEARILDAIAQRGNFTWRTTFGVWNRTDIETDGNKSYTDVLLWGTETFDVVVLDVTPTAARINKGIAFTLGQADSSLILVKKGSRESPTISWWKFLKPFEYTVWAAIVGVVVVSSIAYQFLEQLGMDRGEHSFRQWATVNLYKSILNFTGNYSYEPTTLGGRIFGFFFAFWAMLISAAYTANLASILVKERYPEPEIRNLQDAIAKQLTICVHVGSAAEDYLTQNYSPQIDALLVPVEKDDVYKALFPSPNDNNNNNRCDISVTKKQEFQTKRWQEEFNPDCLLEWQGRVVIPQKDGFATKHSPGIKCTDLINEVFSYHIQEMNDKGILQEFWDEHEEFYKTEGHCLVHDGDGDHETASSSAGDSSKPAPSSNRTSGALTAKDMAGTMLVQFVGSLVAILVALLSRCEGRTKIKRRLWRERSVAQGSGNTQTADDLAALRQQVGGLLRQLDRLDDYSSRLENLSQRVETMQESIAPSLHQNHDNGTDRGHCPFDEVETEADLPPTGVAKLRRISMIGEQE